MSNYPAANKAAWPLALRGDLAPDRVAELRARAESLAAAAQYGWGHTIDFGAFTMPGLLGDKWLRLAGVLDEWDWWPASLAGHRVADVGAFTGGLSLLMAARGAAEVAAVDEVPEHLDQCRFAAEALGVADRVRTEQASLYDLEDRLGPGRLDLVLCAGVLYHLSDMLVGLIVLQRLLRPGGVLLLESNAIESFEHSYANYGRYVGGMWWQPTALCIADMCEHAGFEAPDIRFYAPGRALVRVVKPEGAKVPFRRGLHHPVDSLRDDAERTLDLGELAPAPALGADAGMLRRWLWQMAGRALRLPMILGYRFRRLTRRSRRAQ